MIAVLNKFYFQGLGHIKHHLFPALQRIKKKKKSWTMGITAKYQASV